jgi:hypothetical protein
MTATATLEHVREQLRRVGPVAYLVTINETGTPHCVAVTVRMIDDLLVMTPGNKSVANASARGHVSILWPPEQWGEHSFIVDGQVESATGSGRGDNSVTVRPSRAVLHPSINPHDGQPSPSGCVVVYQSGHQR